MINRNILYKLSRSIVPMLCITPSIGMCYAFSLISKPMLDIFGCSLIAMQFAFCLNIMCLGFGSAIFGKLVEYKIKTAAWLSTVLFSCGLLMSGLSLTLGNLPMLYVGFGILCGVGEGIGYVTPVLNNILWFGKNKYKGLVAATSIICFGLGASICSLLFGWFNPTFGIEKFVYGLSILYFIVMSTGACMISKPRWAMLKNKSPKTRKKFNYRAFISDGYSFKTWTYMLLNISSGLVLIGLCVPLMKLSGFNEVAITLTCTVCGAFNGGGRLVFPFLSDFMKRRSDILKYIVILEILCVVSSALFPIMLPISLVIINATYGSFFALLPAILSDHYGNDCLSIRHSAILSAWGMSSLVAFLITMGICMFSGLNLIWVLGVVAVVYVLNLIVVWKIK